MGSTGGHRAFPVFRLPVPDVRSFEASSWLRRGGCVPLQRTEKTWCPNQTTDEDRHKTRRRRRALTFRCSSDPRPLRA